MRPSSRQPRSLYELSSLAHEVRQLLFAVRKECSHGVPVGAARVRLKARLALAKNRYGEIQRSLAETPRLTPAQLQQARMAMGGILASLREVEKLTLAAADPQAGREG